jgi:hypothetical protein
VPGSPAGRHRMVVLCPCGPRSHRSGSIGGDRCPSKKGSTDEGLCVPDLANGKRYIAVRFFEIAPSPREIREAAQTMGSVPILNLRVLRSMAFLGVQEHQARRWAEAFHGAWFERRIR